MTTTQPSHPTALRLWLVREHGDPVALTAAADRQAATRLAASATSLALGDLSCALVGTAMPGAARVVSVLRGAEVHGTAPSVVLGEPEEVKPTPTRRRQPIRGSSVLGSAYRRGCAAAGLAEEEVRDRQTRVASVVRHAIWAAMVEMDYRLHEIGGVTGHHFGAVSAAVSHPRRRSEEMQALAEVVKARTLAALREADASMR